jgi:CDP-diacylglycerol--glycerol-3-phosphate 3-phosphatidyltransferase
VSERAGRATTLLTRITLARILMVPAVMALVMIGDRSPQAFVWAALLFLLAALTDFVDGFLARRWALTTTLGSFLDTTADKLLVGGVLIALVEAGRASAWVAAIIIGRELLIMGLRGIVAVDGAVIKPSIWGKLKANTQFLAIALAMLRPRLEIGPLLLDEWMMIAAAGITVMSAWDYIARWVLRLVPPRTG